MAKYIINIPNNKIYNYVGSTHLLMPYTMAEHKGHHDTGLRLTPYTESDQSNREAIENEVWEFAQKFTHESKAELNAHERMEIWGTASCDKIINDFTYSEAKEKYEAWRKQKDEIHVGDEVYDHTISGTGIVTNVENKNMVGVMWDDGSVNDSVSVKDLRKTGRHFDEVEDLLKKIKEK